MQISSRQSSAQSSDYWGPRFELQELLDKTPKITPEVDALLADNEALEEFTNLTPGAAKTKVDAEISEAELRAEGTEEQIPESDLERENL